MNKRTIFALTSGLLAAALGGVWQQVRRPVPSPTGTLRLPGLHGRVEILTDGRGIPHIYAANESDLFWAQGFTMARERLFQMDFYRRFSAGRLSEVAGEATLEIDRWQRMFGLRRSAEKAWPHTGEAARVALLAFSAGVNAALDEMSAHGALPIEVRLLGYTPERWTPVDSLAVLRIMALALSVGWEADLLREGLEKRLGAEGAARAFALPHPAFPPIDSPGLAEALRLASGAGAGSNSWVVDGSRTETGLPMLANDPHLALRLPTIWFAQHLECPTLQAAGCAMAGVPGIILGHNEHGAWGATSGYADVQDLYIEERVESDGGTLAFRWGDTTLPATILEERIVVKGKAEPVAQRVVLTRHGPLISDLLADESRDLALRWSIDEPDDAVGAILGVDRATNWEEFRRALADFGAPPLSFSWADRSGTIGWLLAGRIPIRQGAPGVVPVDGSSGENEWLGYIPVEELPQAVNPPAGYLVHSNNRPVGKEYQHWLGVDFYPGFRAGRIAALIEARAAHTVESFRAIQADVYSFPEHRLAQVMGALPALSGPLREMQEMLRAWDGRMTLESVAATLAHHLFHQVRHHLVADELASWTARWQGKVSQIELQNLLPHAFGSWAWVLERLEEPEHPWWTLEGTPRRLHRDEALILALQETVRQLRSRWGNDPQKWNWGRVHQRSLEHPLGALPLLGRWFSRGPYPMPGGPFSPNPDLGTIHYHQPLPAISATTRLIADLSDWDNYHLSLPGNSGHPASPHYTDGVKGWRQVQLSPFPWSRSAVEKAAEGRIVVEPA